MTDQNCDAPGTQPAVSGAAPGGASGNGSGGAARKDDLLSLVGKIGRPDSELLDVVFDRVYTLAFQTLAPLVGEDAASEYAQDAVVEVFEKYFETGFPTLEELKLEAVKIAKKR